MQPHVDDLASFLGAIDAASAHLVGSSWGGFICLLTAIRHPELVSTLVLEEPPVLSLFVSTPPKPRELLPLLLRRPLLALAIVRFGARTIAPAQRAFRRGHDEEAIRRFGLGVLGREGYAASARRACARNITRVASRSVATLAMLRARSR
jgi:pimeloyl-ACP methyl ester carboxylesterase